MFDPWLYLVRVNKHCWNYIFITWRWSNVKITADKTVFYSIPDGGRFPISKVLKTGILYEKHIFINTNIIIFFINTLSTDLGVILHETLVNTHICHFPNKSSFCIILTISIISRGMHKIPYAFILPRNAYKVFVMVPLWWEMSVNFHIHNPT